jgi:hypothetical protein
MAEVALRGLLEELIARLKSLAGNDNMAAVQTSQILGAFVRAWQAGVVEPSGLLWNDSLARELKDLGCFHVVPILDMMSNESKNVEERVLNMFDVQLSILQGVMRVSGGACLTSQILGPMITMFYYKVLVPSGMDQSEEIRRTLIGTGFGR